MAREMKDSGIEWIGEVPREWEYVRLKYFYEFEKGKNAAQYTQEYIGSHNGDYPVYSGQTENDGIMGRIDTFDYDITECLFTTTVGAKVMTPKILCGKFSLSQNCLIMKQINECNNKFIYYTLFSLFDYEKSLIPTYMQPSLRMEDLKKYGFFVPGENEQQKIASFLDGECLELDNILAKTCASIEEYKKLKQAVITQAVTKGIRGDREMKDSGIEWNNQIPADWDSINPKALFRQRKDKAFEGEKQLTASQQYGIMYQSDYMEMTGTKVVTVEKDFDILKHVEAGDFVISMRSFQGGLEYSELSGSISSAYVMLVPNLELVYSRFYRWLFKSEVYISALQSTSNMVRDGQAMRYSNFLQVRLYIVPMEEQKEIAKYLDEKCGIIDELIAKKEQYLSEIENYKKSLIYEYVTGKKEVPCKTI